MPEAKLEVDHRQDTDRKRGQESVTKSKFVHNGANMHYPLGVSSQSGKGNPEANTKLILLYGTRQQLTSEAANPNTDLETCSKHSLQIRLTAEDTSGLLVKIPCDSSSRS